MLFTHLYALLFHRLKLGTINQKNMNTYLDLLKVMSILMVYLVNLKVVVVSTLRIA